MNTPKLKSLQHGALHHCFGCGTVNKTGLRLKFFVDEEHTVVCRVRVPRRFEGPAGYTHGGIIATLLDEAMSKANCQFKIVAMTRQMEVEYLKPVPLLTPVTLTARHVHSTGRKHRCEAQIVNDNGIVLARARALFIAVDAETVRRLTAGL